MKKMTKVWLTAALFAVLAGALMLFGACGTEKQEGGIGKYFNIVEGPSVIYDVEGPAGMNITFDKYYMSAGVVNISGRDIKIYFICTFESYEFRSNTVIMDADDPRLIYKLRASVPRGAWMNQSACHTMFYWEFADDQ